MSASCGTSFVGNGGEIQTVN